MSEELGFDALIDKLRAVVQKLEDGNISLEDALREYEDGVALARRGHQILDAAETRVELLVKAPSEDSGEVTTPLSEGDA